MANIGEIDENLLKLYLIYLRDNTKTELPYIGTITSVSFDAIEYPRWPNNITLENLKNLNQNQTNQLLIHLNIKKAPPKAKSDVYINGFGISLKSLQGAPPALINHTHRNGFLKVANRISEDISLLDSLINNYWTLRLNGIISEDIGAISLNSPFRSEQAKQIIKPYLNYFLFDGTGQAISPYRAEYLLDVTNVFDITTWHIYDKDNAISDNIYNRLVFSLRSKGMSANYPNIKNKNIIEPWTRFCNDKYKGSLHVRFK